MSTNLQKPSLNEFCNSMFALAQLEAELKKTVPDQEFIDKIRMWSAGLFRLVVMGEVKKGKSSFINALLGVKDLVPVSSDIATSTIYKICYGTEKAYKVFFSQESGKTPLFITAAELAAYGTENGNPGNEKAVDFIQIFVPSPILKNGLVIIDTPGLGGLFKQHKRITYEYVPKADAVFMVSDSVESPIGQAELDLLADIQKITDQVFFVQTKAMAVGTEERVSREKNNRNTLINHGHIPEEKLRYFVVDSHLKHEADEAQDQDDLEDSGFIRLAAFINSEIIPNTQHTLMKNALKVMLPKYTLVASNIAQMEKICAANTQQQQEEIRQQLKLAEEDLKKMQDKLPDLQDRLQDGIKKVRREVMDFLKYCRPNGDMHVEFEQAINNTDNIDDLLELVNNIREKLPNMMSEFRYEACSIVQTGITALLNELSQYSTTLGNNMIVRDENMSIDDSVRINSAGLERVIEQNIPQGAFSFDNLRTSMFGAMAGITLGGAIGSVIPGIGTAIGMGVGRVVGAVIGGWKATSIKQQQELKSAKSQTSAAISGAVSSAYQEVSESVSRVIDDISSDTMKAVRNAISRYQNELKENNEELKKRQAMSMQVVLDEKKKVETYKQQFAAIEKIVKAI